nr:hypothetical protein [uncultured Sphingomonas sp.]
MSSEVASGYRPVGKHRFGLSIVAPVILYGLACWTLFSWLGDKTAPRALWLGISVIMIARSFHSLIDPSQYRRNPFISGKLRRLRAEDAFNILFFTVIGMVCLQRLLADPACKTLFFSE